MEDARLPVIDDETATPLPERTRGGTRKLAFQALAALAFTMALVGGLVRSSSGSSTIGGSNTRDLGGIVDQYKDEIFKEEEGGAMETLTMGKIEAEEKISTESPTWAPTEEGTTGGPTNTYFPTEEWPEEEDDEYYDDEEDDEYDDEEDDEYDDDEGV